MNVYLSNLGCKLNQAELEGFARGFTAAGHEVVAALGEADVHVVNSCTVTHLAARDSRRLARRAGRLHSGVKTVLTGCYAAAEPREAAELPGVDLVVPNSEKETLVERVLETFPDLADGSAASQRPDSTLELPVPYVPLAFGNARALVKVEDGCNMSCSFCIIPMTRGRQQSRPVEDVVAEVRGLAAGGFSEVVVTGVQISSYRWRGQGLYDLVRRILDQTDVGRLRLTSIAPWQFDRRLLELAAGGRVCRHFHLSLQSGCSATLARMRRPYDAAQFAELLETLREHVPGVAITTDVIAGFPGETAGEFEESLAFVEACRFARIHAFTYSARPGTAAAEMPGQIEPALRKERVRRLIAAGAAAERAFRKEHLGETAEILWEHERDGVWRGTTDHYIPVTTTSRNDLARRLSRCRLLALGERGVAVRPPRVAEIA